ncbi:MAG TPA: MinD/ParA family protein [Blastocatellia bacterium]|nr:MinD/ParA family protein [Blastocatellia bacterium]
MDQATGLRELVRRQQTNNSASLRKSMERTMRIVAVTSGKGGVGKSNFVANTAMALADRGERVVIFDADFGLANIDVLYGLSPTWNLGHVLRGEKKFSEIMLGGPRGVLIVPATSGVQEMAELTAYQREELLSNLTQLNSEADYLLIDTASGIAQNVTHLLNLADEVVVVTTPEPTALVDAYAIIKLVIGECETKPVSVVVNQVEYSNDAGLVVDELNMITNRFLNRRVTLLGGIEKDHNVVQAVQAQKPLLDYSPNSPAGRSFRVIAERLTRNGRKPSLQSAARAAYQTSTGLQMRI